MQDIAVGARRQAGVQRTSGPGVLRLAVEQHKGFVVPAECNLVGRAAGPVGNGTCTRQIAPGHHVCHLLDAVLAHPVLAVAAVRAVGHAHRGRTRVGVGEVIRRHDTHVGVGPGEHECVGEGVQCAVLVGQLCAAVALGVMIVQEAHGVLVGHKSPGLAEVLQVLHFALGDNVLVQIVGVVKLGYLSCGVIHAGLHGFTSAANDLLAHIKPGR
mmetsp:Transcript_14662/g.25794  ORF Transcript_14662/g.25794 Transcript_14662/m.25794 type:complete len:213 (+) Transcript_14662:943-1581(+)